MIVAKLTDSTGTTQLPMLEQGFNEVTIENATDVQTLDANIYTDFINNKRQWTIVYDHLDKATYDTIKGYYDRQFTEFKYPTLTIDFYGISVDTRMWLNPKNIWNGCGSVENIEITLRESNQLP